MVVQKGLTAGTKFSVKFALASCFELPQWSSSEFFTCQITHFRLCRCPFASSVPGQLRTYRCPTVRRSPGYSWIKPTWELMGRCQHHRQYTKTALTEFIEFYVWLLMSCWTFGMHERALVLWETSSKVFGFCSRKFVPSIGKPPTMPLVGLWHGG